MIDPSAPLGYRGRYAEPPRRPPAPGSANDPPRGRWADRRSPPSGPPTPPPPRALQPVQAGQPWPAGPGAPVTGAPLPVPQPRRVPRKDPGGLVAGLVIASVGLFFLAGQITPEVGRFVTLLIGIALMVVFLLRQEYGFLVPGSILTGVGVGIVLQPHASGDIGGGAMLLSLAGGFLGIWVVGSLFRLRQNHWWPLIPGGILTLVGLVQLSRADVGGALRLWPVILIVVGAVVVGRALQRRPAG